MRFNKIISILLITYILITLGLILYNNQKNFLTFNYWQTFSEQKDVFYASQYKTKKYEAFIPDETAYSYVGGALIKGENPVFNIPEAPPLGKYLIGLSAIWFNNPNIIIVLVFGLAGLGMLYLLSRQILGPSFLSLIPVAAIVSEPLYHDQYKFVPLFDLAQLLFIVTIFYFFNKALLSKKKAWLFFALANLFVGFFIATKFYSSGAPVLAAMGIVLIVHRYWEKLFDLLKTIWLPVVVLLATYIRVFAFNPSIREFLGIQKWILIYWKGALILPFTTWDLLLFNRWHTWWGDNRITTDVHWHIFWPIITVISFSTIVIYLLKKIPHKKEIEILLAFIVCYGAFISVGTPTVRYYTIFLPFLYIISVYASQCLFTNYFEPHKTVKKKTPK